MKKELYILVLVCLFFSTTKATTYHPFPSNSGSWNYRYYDAMNVATLAYTAYTLGGDTSILGINFKKIQKNYMYAGAIRESNKKIYFVPDTATREYELYNFNLSVGDTVKNRFGPAPCVNGIVTVQSVDSVLMQTTYYRRINMNNSVQWVEGIGSFYYLLEPCNFLCVSGNDYLQCKVGDAGTIEFATSASLCLLGLNDLSKKNTLVEIFPNPFINELEITLKEFSSSVSIEIADISGRFFYKTSTSGTQTKFKVSTSEWENGFYFLRINNENYKLVKN